MQIIELNAGELMQKMIVDDPFMIPSTLHSLNKK